MPWEIDGEYIREWMADLDNGTYNSVIAAFGLLARVGPGLGRPMVDSVAGSRHKGMKELRPGSSGRSEIRILFIFDPTRNAVMLLAGDKHGEWSKWYSKQIPVADERYDRYLRTMARGGE